MFKKYGLLGIILIIFAEINFFLKIQPFANWSFPIIWFGYIMSIDALVYKLKKDSLINNRFSQFFGIILISMPLWWIFEFINIPLKNWNYYGIEKLGVWKDVFGALSFSTVLPALFETTELIRSVRLFDGKKLHKNFKITKRFLYFMIIIGVACFVAPLLLPSYAFPLVWVSLFFILDPINYLHNQPSILGSLKGRKLAVPLSLLLAGIILGFLWEFWNYWAMPKWTYDIPYVGFFKIFEMPLLGYLGYLPFSFELYSMYWFVRSLFIHKEHLLFK